MFSLKKILWLLFFFLNVAPVSADPNFWKYEWPKTDFSKSSVEFIEILSGGPPKDGIPAIDHPQFIEMNKLSGLNEREGVITVEWAGEVRVYPLRILMWHEIVNDTIGGVPVSVTYCPLCNSAIVFERKLLDGRVLDFGTTGKLRNSDLVMYDRQTETWWQQFTGQAIVGELLGTALSIIPSRLESWAAFKERHQSALVLIPSDPKARQYGRNPYVGYAKSARPFLYGGEMPKGIAPMAPVLVVGNKAWAIEYVKAQKTIQADGLTITWKSGQASALEGKTVFQGSDLGNVTVQKNGHDVAYHLSFAFAYHAFYPNGEIIK
ncbi:conserved exported hypothetical protein [Candidatus Terasakiella magnetica]|uniref:DUF3179 domain-containing protein n=1 Tax=Candidatus Terasakiella magnetica TaxID=1867952 RepID=A0A1C3RDA2_9PROT|nr:DUF3179 domain-containing protein [Candidatus Terasakiella magnetica]SCA55222.1 conserved exported hypothetical protein [Candidatus Terasakiella magnetica]